MEWAALADVGLRALSPGSSPAGAGGMPISSSAGSGPATVYGGNISFNKGEGWPMWLALAAAALAVVIILKR